MIRVITWPLSRRRRLVRVFKFKFSEPNMRLRLSRRLVGRTRRRHVCCREDSTSTVRLRSWRSHGPSRLGPGTPTEIEINACQGKGKERRQGQEEGEEGGSDSHSCSGACSRGKGTTQIFIPVAHFLNVGAFCRLARSRTRLPLEKPAGNCAHRAWEGPTRL